MVGSVRLDNSVSERQNGGLVGHVADVASDQRCRAVGRGDFGGLGHVVG